MIALDAAQRGLGKLDADLKLIAAELDDRWEVLAEAIQTVMRRYGQADAYEQLKELTRGRAIDATRLRKFIGELDPPAAARNARGSAFRLHGPPPTSAWLPSSAAPHGL